MTAAHTTGGGAAYTGEIHVYRIGWWTHRWWPSRVTWMGLLTGNQPSPRADNGRRFVGRRTIALTAWRHLRRIRRPHRPWQADYDGGAWARRAWTAEGARRKAEADQACLLATGQWSPWVQRKRLRRYGADAATGPGPGAGS